MKYVKVILLAVMLFMFAAVAVNAWGRRDYYEQRHNQVERLHSESNCEELSPWEETYLLRKQSRIQREIYQALADSRLTWRERKRLEDMLERHSERLYFERHAEDYHSCYTGCGHEGGVVRLKAGPRGVSFGISLFDLDLR